MTWEPTNELRWVIRLVEEDPFSVMVDAVGNRVQPVATFLQQKWRMEWSVVATHVEYKFEWRDVPTEIEG
jgi:hypothetical protein